jgi:TPP-dependent pyruvate/acetoin dehydrogenase alpha subunit
MTNHTPESLIAFSNRVRDAFLAKQIRCPVHFCSDTQAGPLVEIFKHIAPTDWVFCTWRNSFHALLKGIPKDELFQMIVDGRSMFIMSKEHRFFCSSIVGGILPIALGVAAGIKRNRENYYGDWPAPDREWGLVHVFVGDMCSTTGLFAEFSRYAEGHDLPVRIVIENNDLSTNARTRDVWGHGQWQPDRHHYYTYKRTHPHVGLLEKVSF